MKLTKSKDLAFLQATGKKILVSLVHVEEKKGALILPEQKTYQVGKVESVGIEVDKAIQDANYVFFRVHAGNILKYRGNEFICIQEMDVYATAQEPA